MGGQVIAGALAFADSTLTITDGFNVVGINAFNQSTISIKGGSAGRTIAYNRSTIFVTGGSVLGLTARNESTVMIGGGSITPEPVGCG